MGANAVRLPTPHGEMSLLTQFESELIKKPGFSADLLDLHDPGCAMWMSREDYM